MADRNTQCGPYSPGHSGDSADSYSFAWGLASISCNNSLSRKTVTDANLREKAVCIQTIISCSVLEGWERQYPEFITCYFLPPKYIYLVNEPLLPHKAVQAQILVGVVGRWRLKNTKLKSKTKVQERHRVDADVCLCRHYSLSAAESHEVILLKTLERGEGARGGSEEGSPCWKCLSGVRCYDRLFWYTSSFILDRSPSLGSTDIISIV